MIKVVLLKSCAGKIGGLEKTTGSLIQAFLEKGCDLTLLTTGCSKEHQPDYKVINFDNAPKIWSMRRLSHFNKACSNYLRKHSFDIVFGLDRNPFQTHYRAGNGVHKAYLKRRKHSEALLKSLSFSINPLHRKILQLEKHAFEHPELKLLITNSEMVRQEILQNYTTPSNKIQVIPNGVDWNGYQVPFLEKKTRESTFRFLFIGNGYQRKGLNFLLQALHLIHKQEFQLTVAGKDKNINRYRTLAKKLNLDKKVTFLGPVSSTLPLYQTADCVVIPSTYDPFANVTVEALAMGIPVISSAGNGGSEIITPDVGYIVKEPANSEHLALVLLEMLNTPFHSETIRQKVRHLDSVKLMNTLVEKCL